MNILIISHLYVPFSKVGAKRMYALACYFAEKGHNIEILKANDKEYGNDIIPESSNQNGNFDNIHITSLNRCLKSNIGRRFFRVNQYYSLAKRLFSKRVYDFVFISAGPFNYLKVATKLKKKYPEICVILDFRDLLDGTQCRDGKISLVKEISYLFDRRIERNAVRLANHCLTVTNQMNRIYQKRYPEYREKFFNIQNGYDDIIVPKSVQNEIVLNKKERKIGQQLKIGIFGKYSFYSERFITILVNAVFSVIKEGMDVCVVQYGYYEQELEAAFEKKGIKDKYVFVKSNGYTDDLISLEECDAFIATSFHKFALGTKIFDYIWLNRPIITMNPNLDSEQVELTKRFEHGYVCNSDNQLIKALQSISRERIMCLDSDLNLINKYGRRYQFDKLSKVLFNN